MSILERIIGDAGRVSYRLKFPLWIQLLLTAWTIVGLGASFFVMWQDVEIALALSLSALVAWCAGGNLTLSWRSRPSMVYRDQIKTLKTEMHRLVALLDGPCQFEDGSNADTSHAHFLLEEDDEKSE